MTEGVQHSQRLKASAKSESARPYPGLPFCAGKERWTPAQNAQFIQAVLNQEQVGVAIIGVDARVQQSNGTFSSLLFYRQGELEGKVLEGLACRLKPTRESAGAPQTEVCGSAEVNDLLRKSGETLPCFVEAHAIRNRRGEVNHIVVFATDARSHEITVEHNLFESRLFQSQSLQILGLLAAGVAHDFNNALEVIIGFASLARIRLSSSDPLHEPLKIIEDSAKGAAGLAKQLLDVSKDQPENEQDIDVADLVSSVVVIISRTFDRKIQVEHQIGPGLPSTRGIPNRLRQALLNLCINARDALQKGGSLAIKATCQTLKEGDSRLPSTNGPGTYIQIAVLDNGIGMIPELIEHIFDPLFTTKASGQGSGLGLAMVDRIVKEARGFITVTSVPGKGSEFSIYLPAAFSREPRPSGSPAMSLISGQGKILVVDDEPRVLEFLEKGLTRLGYEVLSAENGDLACKIYSRQFNQISCVVLDLIMPGMSGLEAYSHLRDINPAVRVILSSGYSSGRINPDAVEAGSPEFLEKPYTLEELSLTLQKIQKN